MSNLYSIGFDGTLNIEYPTSISVSMVVGYIINNMLYYQYNKQPSPVI